MIRHVALLKWKPEADASLHEAFEQGMRELPTKIPGIRRFTCGANIGASGESIIAKQGFTANFDYAIMADLDDYAAYERYADHPDHLAFIADVVRHLVQERVAIQLDLGEASA